MKLKSPVEAEWGVQSWEKGRTLSKVEIEGGRKEDR